MNQDQYAAMLARIEKIKQEVSEEYRELAGRYDLDENYEEEFDDTLQRKYTEGGADYLEIVIGILREATPILDRYEEGYDDGTVSTLEEMATIYEGVADTDLGKEYLGGDQE